MLYVTDLAVLPRARRYGFGKFCYEGGGIRQTLRRGESVPPPLHGQPRREENVQENGIFQGQAREHFMSSLNFLGEHLRTPFEKYMDSNYTRWHLKVGEAFLRL